MYDRRGRLQVAWTLACCYGTVDMSRAAAAAAAAAAGRWSWWWW